MQRPVLFHYHTGFLRSQETLSCNYSYGLQHGPPITAKRPVSVHFINSSSRRIFITYESTSPVHKLPVELVCYKRTLVLLSRWQWIKRHRQDDMSFRDELGGPYNIYVYTVINIAGSPRPIASQRLWRQLSQLDWPRMPSLPWRLKFIKRARSQTLYKKLKYNVFNL